MAAFNPGEQYKVTHQGIVYDKDDEQWIITKNTVVEHLKDLGEGKHKFKIISGRLEAKWELNESIGLEIMVRTNIWCGRLEPV